MRQAFETGLALLKIHVLRKRVPLFLSWNITFRCNLRCMYCAACDAPHNELDTKEVLSYLDSLWRLGTRWITFGGGEPLVRRDIDEILQGSRRRGFQTYLSTNGWLLGEHTDVVRDCVNHVNLSLDGAREVHDRVRGEGSYDKVIEAIGICKSLGIPLSLQCVLNRYNLDSVDEAVSAARRYDVPIMFQPATKWLSTSVKENPIAPETGEYRKAIDHIVQLKKKGAPVRNSFAGLRHLALWPDPHPIFCVAGRAMAILEADGSLLACHQCQVKDFLDGSTSRGSFEEKFAAMRLPVRCAQCWCAPVVELCLFFSLRPEPMLNALRNR
jgi:MoaA/NifB/PqqE/SkfB family radical SAM enzyme